jgi:hypothetical protein
MSAVQAAHREFLSSNGSFFLALDGEATIEQRQLKWGLKGGLRSSTYNLAEVDLKHGSRNWSVPVMCQLVSSFQEIISGIPRMRCASVPPEEM